MPPLGGQAVGLAHSSGLRRMASFSVLEPPANESEELLPIRYWPAAHSAPTMQRAVPVPFMRPQVAAGIQRLRSGDFRNLHERYVRLEFRNASLREWWTIRCTRPTSGGLDIPLTMVWRAAGYPRDPTLAARVSMGFSLAPACFDVIVDEPAERQLWQEWGAVVWWTLLEVEQDRLRALGHDAGFAISRERESLWQIPPTPFGIPICECEITLRDAQGRPF
jgi:hypothetical protein